MDVRGFDLIDYLMNEKLTIEANSYTDFKIALASRNF